MKYSKQFTEHTEYAFNGFCKVVLYQEALNAWRDIKRKQQREISLDYLISETSFVPSAMDKYFEKQDAPTAFCVQGKTVIIASKKLATAISRLAGERREILFLYFFLGYRDYEIGRLYGIGRSAANSRRRIAIKHLRKEWGNLENDTF